MILSYLKTALLKGLNKLRYIKNALVVRVTSDKSPLKKLYPIKFSNFIIITYTPFMHYKWTINNDETDSCGIS